MSKKFIRLPEVKNKTGLSRSSIYLRMSNGEFPQSISLGSRAIAWLEADIEQWFDDRIKESKGLTMSNPNRIKMHRSYTVIEISEVLGVHPKTVRNWIRVGLPVVDEKRLF